MHCVDFLTNKQKLHSLSNRSNWFVWAFVLCDFMLQLQKLMCFACNDDQYFEVVLSWINFQVNFGKWCCEIFVQISISVFLPFVRSSFLFSLFNRFNYFKSCCHQAQKSHSNTSQAIVSFNIFHVSLTKKKIN